MTRNQKILTVVLAAAIATTGLSWVLFHSGIDPQQAANAGGVVISSGPQQSNPDRSKPLIDPKNLTPEITRTRRVLDYAYPVEAAERLMPRIIEIESDWATSQFVSASTPIEHFAQHWQDSIHDPDNALTSSQRAALTVAVAEQIAPRAARTPELFITQHEQQDNLIWRDPDQPIPGTGDRTFRQSLEWTFREYETPLDPGAGAQSLLESLWDPMMNKFGQRITEVGVGPRGAAIIVMRSSLPAQALNGGFSDLYASRHDLDYKRWRGVAAAKGIAFSDTILTGDDLLNELDTVTRASAHIVVRTAAGDDRIFILRMDFFHDPESEQWRIERAGSSGSYTWGLVF